MEIDSVSLACSVPFAGKERMNGHVLDEDDAPSLAGAMLEERQSPRAHGQSDNCKAHQNKLVAAGSHKGLHA